MKKTSPAVALKFYIQHKVHIAELNRSGYVIMILIDGTGIQYKVRYFDEAELREVYFYDWELTEVKG